jgi:hypothetical protein
MNAARKLEYRALSPILRDNVFYKPGESIELTAEAAEPMLAIGVIQPVDDNHDGKPDSAPSTRGRKAAKDADPR